MNSIRLSRPGAFLFSIARIAREMTYIVSGFR